MPTDTQQPNVNPGSQENPQMPIQENKPQEAQTQTQTPAPEKVDSSKDVEAVDAEEKARMEEIRKAQEAAQQKAEKREDEIKADLAQKTEEASKDMNKVREQGLSKAQETINAVDGAQTPEAPKETPVQEVKNEEIKPDSTQAAQTEIPKNNVDLAEVGQDTAMNAAGAATSGPVVSGAGNVEQKKPWWDIFGLTTRKKDDKTNSEPTQASKNVIAGGDFEKIEGLTEKDADEHDKTRENETKQEAGQNPENKY